MAVVDLASLPNKTIGTLAGSDQLLLNTGGAPADVTVDVLAEYVEDAMQPALDALGVAAAAGTTAAGVVAGDLAALESDLGSSAAGKGDALVVTAAAPGGLWTTVRGFIAALLGPTGSSLVGYMPAGTGAVATTVQGKLRESVSIMDYAYLAVDDGGANEDWSPAFNAALLGPVNKVTTPRRQFLVKYPIIVGSSRSLAGDSPSFNSGTRIKVNSTAIWPADRGVLESDNFSWVGGVSQGATPNYWFWASIENLFIDANDIADYGVVAWSAGEEALLRRLNVNNAVKDNMFIGGYPAVMQVEDCSVWGAGRYGVAMTNHPDANFAPTITTAQGGRGNGGSIRFIGISGDHNASGHLFADGTQIVEVIGLKSEFNFPCIQIAGSAVSNDRQRWNISGYRYEAGTTNPTRDFINIAGTGKPQIVIGAGACYNAINLINDTVLGTTVLKGAEGRVTVYDVDDTIQLHAVSLLAPATTVMRSKKANTNAIFSMQASWTTDYRMKFQAASAAQPYSWLVGPSDIPIITCSGQNGESLDLYGSDGTTSTAAINITSAAGVPSVKLGKATTHKVAFYGSTPVAKQTITGTKGGNAALTDLIAKLATLGIIVDSTT